MTITLQLMTGRKAHQPALFIYGFKGCFIFYNYFKTSHRSLGILVTSGFLKMMTNTRLCWGGSLFAVTYGCLCSCLVWPLLLLSDKLLTTAHAVLCIHQASPVQVIYLEFFFFFSKVFTATVTLQGLGRVHWLPYIMLMGATDVLQLYLFGSHVTFLLS